MAYSVIKKPSEYFNTKLYTGNGSTQSITGVNFQTDFTWVKNRSNVSDHILVNSISGVDKNLKSNSSGAEITNAARIISFDTDGLTVGSDVNNSGNTYASWNWKANGAGVANTDGSISSTVSANTTSGFSIVKWTGDSSASATVGHGLGTTPAVIITKELNGTDYWHVWHKNLTNPNNLFLNTTLAQQAPADGTLSNVGSSTFGFQGATNVVAVNESGIDNIGYCFAEKQGFSKFGSYVGNSSTDGAFVYTGFKPAFLLIKNASADQSWWMWDNKRIGYNGGGNHRFRTNGSDAEFADSTSKVDLLSNGFKWRDGDNAYNFSGNNFIYMCFAEQPLVGDNPATAR